MQTTIDSYKERVGRLDLEGIDFGDFVAEPLSEEALSCLRYMHDIEHHTVCYLRDLLVTSAHRDPEITTFLSCWVFEEMWHGEAIGQVLAAHGEPAGTERIAEMRRAKKVKDTLGMFMHALGSAAIGSNFLSLHMTWGAINEWSTQAGYSRLAVLANHPTLSELLKRIMKQEGRHIDFYASEATRRLEHSPRSQKMVRGTLKRLWRPVGTGVKSEAEVDQLISYLLAGDEGMAMAERIDRRVDKLPGLAGLHLLRGAVTDAVKRQNNRHPLTSAAPKDRVKTVPVPAS